MRSDKETYSQPLTTVLQQGVSLFLTPMNKPQCSSLDPSNIPTPAFASHPAHETPHRVSAPSL